jgi:hypothetical protein
MVANGKRNTIEFRDLIGGITRRRKRQIGEIIKFADDSALLLFVSVPPKSKDDLKSMDSLYFDLCTGPERAALSVGLMEYVKPTAAWSIMQQLTAHLSQLPELEKIKCPLCGGLGRTKADAKPGNLCPQCHGRGKILANEQATSEPLRTPLRDSVPTTSAPLQEVAEAVKTVLQETEVDRHDQITS